MCIRDSDNSVATLSAAIEPIMIVLVGGIVATLLLGMYLPIFSAGELFAVLNKGKVKLCLY